MKKDLHPKWPDMPVTVAQRLLHVLDIFEDSPGDMRVIDATTNQYAPHGEQGSWTGLTLMDLRILADVAVGRTYTLADQAKDCQFTFTGDSGARKCSRCDGALIEYSGGGCPKAPKE